MNRPQNITNKKKDVRLKELEMENALLRQKLEMIGGIVGGVRAIEVPKGFYKDDGKSGRTIATVWKVDNDIFFKTSSEEDKEFLERQIELKKDKVAELTAEDVKEEVKKKEDDIVEHFKK